MRNMTNDKIKTGTDENDEAVQHVAKSDKMMNSSGTKINFANPNDERG